MSSEGSSPGRQDGGHDRACGHDQDGGHDRAAGKAGPVRVLLLHPSSELYGSDRVALESARAFVEAGAQVHAVLTEPGPLEPLLSEAGCRTRILAAPVLRKAYLSPRGLPRLVGETARRTPAMVSLLRRVRPDVVYVSTVTQPWWLLLARLVGFPRRRPQVVCHVHEAEESVPRVVRLGLTAPLLLARRVIANSRASADVVTNAVPVLRRRTEVIYNGVPGPDRATPPREQLDGPVRLVLVGRISPRKGTDVAVTALALLRDRGVEATLDLVGGIFPGYEWFEEEVRARVTQAGLDDHVRWRGVQPDVWPALASADIVLVPSRVEPFGNAAVEAMLAWRPVAAGDTQGLREIVTPGNNGRLAAPGDAEDLAAAVTAMVDDWPATLAQAERGRAEAGTLFAPAQYRRRIATAILSRHHAQ